MHEIAAVAVVLLPHITVCAVPCMNTSRARVCASHTPAHNNRCAHLGSTQIYIHHFPRTKTTMPQAQPQHALPQGGKRATTQLPARTPPCARTHALRTWGQGGARRAPVARQLQLLTAAWAKGVQQGAAATAAAGHTQPRARACGGVQTTGSSWRRQNPTAAAAAPAAQPPWARL